MNKPMVSVWTLSCLLVSFTASADSCVQPDELRNTETPYSLWGKCLDFKLITPGTRLPLGSIIYLPRPTDSDESLTISVDRSRLTQQFVDDLFDHPKESILATHHLAQMGVKLVLTPARLRMTIYPTVVVSLRSDIPGDSEYRSFFSETTFLVEQISGRAFASTNLGRISNAFSDVYLQYTMQASNTSMKVLPDGSTQGFAQISGQLPPRQLPSKASD